MMRATCETIERAFTLTTCGKLFITIFHDLRKHDAEDDPNLLSDGDAKRLLLREVYNHSLIKGRVKH